MQEEHLQPIAAPRTHWRAVCILGVAGIAAAALLRVAPAAAQTLLPGGQPTGQLAQAPDGTIYGTTSLGGTNAAGTLFKIDTAGTASTLHEFNGTTDGSYPSSVVVASDGNIYGLTTQITPVVLFKSSPAGAFSTIASKALKGLAIYEGSTIAPSGSEYITFGLFDGAPPYYTTGVKFTTAGVVKNIKVPNTFGSNSVSTAIAPGTSGTAYVGGPGLMTVNSNQKAKVIFTPSRTGYYLGVGTVANEGGGLYADSSGNSFTTAMDVQSGHEYILKLTTKGKPSVLVDDGSLGFLGFGGLTGTSDGTLYAYAYDYSGSHLVSISQAGTVSVLHTFGTVSSGPIPCYEGSTYTYTYTVDGTNPESPLMVAADGSIWGTTYTSTDLSNQCGAYIPPPNQGGAVFQYVPSTGALNIPVGFSG